MHTKRFASKPEAIAFMAKLQRDAQPLTNSKLTVGECLATYAHLFAERQGMPGESPEDVVLRARHSITLTMPSQPSRSS